MSTPSLIAVMTMIWISIISLSLAITKPLVSIAGLYDLHLFPNRDLMDYELSEVHRISQVFHIIAIGFFAFACIVIMVSLFFSARFSESSVSELMGISCICVSVAAFSHLIGICTLIKIALDFKRFADDLPDPITPTAKIETGTIMDIIGIFSSALAFIFIGLAVNNHHRDGRVRL